MSVLLRLGVAAVGIVCVLLCADTPGAEADWTEPLSISQAGLVGSEPQVAIDAAGNTTVVWVSGSSPNRNIRSAYRPASGPWEASNSLLAGILDCHDPQLAVNPAGAALVVADCDAGAAGMNSSYRASAGGSWVQSVVPGSTSGVEPRLALDNAGNAVVVWEKTNNTVQSSYRPAAGGWAAALQASPIGAVALNPQVAISPTGMAWAIWRHKLNRKAGDPVITVEAIRRQGSAAWSAPTLRDLTLAPSETAPVAEGEPQIKWNANGQRMAAWANRPTGVAFMQERWGSGGDFGGWSEPPISLSDGTRNIEVPQIAIDGQARAVAVWRSFDGSGFGVRASTTAAINGSWSASAPLATNQTLLEPQVAIDPAGDATAVWPAIGGGVISAASRPAGGVFGAVTPIKVGGVDPRVAMDAAGDAIVAWAQLGAAIEVAVNDVTAPVLSAVAVPAGVEAGTAAPMTATASDKWSSASVSWNFGDGTTATGGAVSHAYAAAGAKTVTVTATDAVGNATSQTRTISVTQPPTSSVTQPPAAAGGTGPKGKSDDAPRVRLGVVVPKQSWKAIGKAKAVKLSCSLDPIGTCAATATVSGSVAKRLGLKPAKGEKTVRVGSGEVQIASSDRPTTLRLKLTGMARGAIAEARRDVPLTLAVTGSARQHTSVTVTRKFTIRRP
ncbi:MAG TPA: PKD domain-containing protein [Solirubrobacterales bacterium]|nr:PKD domain-containing protein [Solirubrobacterales bacterium]